jgi:exoribonuclease R
MINIDDEQHRSILQRIARRVMMEKGLLTDFSSQAIADLASEQKYSLPKQPDSKALDQFLLVAKNADPLRFPDLCLGVIKLLGPGKYVVELPGSNSAGHFGLAVKDYSHSTAPNRRYADMITQRLLKILPSKEGL